MNDTHVEALIDAFGRAADRVRRRYPEATVGELLFALEHVRHTITEAWLEHSK